MVKITGEYQGDLHCNLVHTPSGSGLLTDAPKDNQGRGEAFSPTDLTGAALGSCMATTMALAARRNGVELAGLRFSVTKTMSADAPRRVIRLATEIWMPATTADAALTSLLEETARTCPVYLSLHPDVDKPVMFHWNG